MKENQSMQDIKKKSCSSLAKMMAARDRDKLKSKKANTSPQLLRQPRSQNYVSLLRRTGELSAALEQLEEEISELELQVVSPLRMEEKNEQPTWVPEEKCTEPVSWLTEQVTTPVESLQQIEELTHRLEELIQKREELVVELQNTYEAFLQEIPEAENTIGLIYPLCNTEVLMRYGVIPCVGSGYASKEELLQQVKPASEKIKQQWLKGDDVYEAYCCFSLLCVEIYMDTICVVWKDGDVLVIE